MISCVFVLRFYPCRLVSQSYPVLCHPYPDLLWPGLLRGSLFLGKSQPWVRSTLPLACWRNLKTELNWFNTNLPSFWALLASRPPRVVCFPCSSYSHTHFSHLCNLSLRWSLSSRLLASLESLHGAAFSSVQCVLSARGVVNQWQPACKSNNKRLSPSVQSYVWPPVPHLPEPLLCARHDVLYR